MRMLQRLFMVLLTMAVLTGSLFASGGQESAETSESGLEKVTLRFYFPGDKRDKTDEVWDLVGEKFKDQLNADFDINTIPFSDYSQKMTVMAASGDDWDMNFDGDWLAYNQMITSEAYMDITDLLPKYAPDLYAAYKSLGSLGAATINGKIMCLPWTMSMNQRPFFKWRDDYADAKGIDIANDSIKTVEQMDEVMMAFREAYPNKKILERAFKEIWLAKYELAPIGYDYFFNLNDPEAKIMPFEQTDAYKEMAIWAKKWQDNDIIWKDVLIDKTNRNQMLNEGLLITHVPSHEWVFAYRPYTEESARAGYSALYLENKYADRTPLANVVAINRNAANPERALMWLNLMETSKEMYDLVQYGIEGVTYVLDGERANYPEGMNGGNSNYMEWGGQWALWKPQYMRPNPAYGEGFWEAEAEFASLPQNVNSPLDGFFPDPTEIQNELTMRQQIFTEYNSLIQVGLVDDAEAIVAEMIQKGKDANIDVVTAELQKQVDAFLANK